MIPSGSFAAIFPRISTRTLAGISTGVPPRILPEIFIVSPSDMALRFFPNICPVIPPGVVSKDFFRNWDSQEILASVPAELFRRVFYRNLSRDISGDPCKHF